MQSGKRLKSLRSGGSRSVPAVGCDARFDLPRRSPDPNRVPFTACDGPATLVMCHSGPAPAEPGIVHPPSFPTCHVCQMYSPWAGGGQVLLGDGHVQFVPTSINLNTWAALSSMNLGDVPGEF